MRVDFYTQIHKAIRRCLYTLSMKLAAHDFFENKGYEVIHQQLIDMNTLLTNHAKHEEVFIQPFIANKQSESSLQIADDHQAQREHIKRIEKMSSQLLALSGEEALQAGLLLYREFNQQISHQLLHMEEEEMLMSILQQISTEEELLAVLLNLVSSFSEAEVIHSATYLLPALNPSERITMMKNMLKGLNEEARSLYLKGAQMALSPTDWLTTKMQLVDY